MCCIRASLAAGLFGIGSSVIKGQLMLAMRIHLADVSATSAYMILFTSSTATTSFIAFGELNYQCGGICLSLELLATIIGQTFMH